MADDKVNGEMAGYLTRAELQTELENRDYVTRAMLQEELGARDMRFDAMDRRFDAMDRRFDAMDQRLIDFEQRMIHSMGQMAIVIGEEVGRQIRGVEERLRVEIRASTEPYRDLAERVARLEEHTGVKR